MLFRPTSIRRLPYPTHQLKPTLSPKQPAIPPSALPQILPPTRGQKALQMSGFVIAIGLTFYSVLIYDFGEGEHCFMPIRRYFDSITSGFFTLTNSERQLLGGSTIPNSNQHGHANGAIVLLSTKTPVEFFKTRLENDDASSDVRSGSSS